MLNSEELHVQLASDVLFGDLPETMVVTGQAIISGGFDARGEENSPKVVFKFKRKTITDVKDEAKTHQQIDLIKITAIG